MKKTFMIALAGMMLFAFTQCGGGGTKEFQANKKMYNDLEKAIDKANSCDELQTAVFTVALSALADQKEYAENEKMTAEEEKKMEELGKQLEEKMTKKSEKLGCDEDDFSL